WKAMSGNVLLILSGQDYTAKEFLEYAASHPEWSPLLAAAARVDLVEADHTFSSTELRTAVEDASIEWLWGLSELLAVTRRQGTEADR
ncbi:MAG: hypothetical protein KAX66_05665, partial [Propionivibrio sp.]|nr:hypothetical protein [Propionivibrio sp.]